MKRIKDRVLGYLYCVIAMTMCGLGLYAFYALMYSLGWADQPLDEALALLIKSGVMMVYVFVILFIFRLPEKKSALYDLATWLIAPTIGAYLGMGTINLLFPLT